MSTNRESRIFTDRRDAGRKLVAPVRELIRSEAVVLGLTRGGVPVADEVAQALAAPLDVIVMARLGVPWQPELAMGALAEGGARVIDDRIVELALVSPRDFAEVERYELNRLLERVERVRGEEPPQMLGGRTALIVDDGLATGASARAAIQVARGRGAGRVVLAVPVASAEGLRAITPLVDEVIALHVPTDFLAVGQFYRDFGEAQDDEVVALLAAAGAEREAALEVREPAEDPGEPASRARVDDLQLVAGSVTLAGRSVVPPGAQDLVILAHDSSRERCSSRSRSLSRQLTDAGFATVLVDLLTRDEESHGNRYLAIPMLTDRLRAVTRAVAPGFARVNYLAAGVAAAVVLEAAAAPDAEIHAVASLAGRPDLVARLGAVRAPVLFIVGAEDTAVLRFNTQALEKVSCPYRLVTIPGSGHRFREPGALREVCAALRVWFTDPSAAS